MKFFLTFAFFLFHLSAWAQVQEKVPPPTVDEENKALRQLFNISAWAQSQETEYRPIIVEDKEADLTSVEKEALRLKREKYKLNKIGVTINTPKEYTALHGSVPYFCINNNSHMDYVFIKKDNNTVIGVSLMGRDSLDYLRDAKYNKLVPPFIENYDPDDQWIINFKGKADSADFKPVLYSDKKLKRYNADGGVEFNRRPCADLLFDDYVLRRVIILNKKHHGIVEINYFVRQNAKVDLDKETKNGAKIVSYYNR